MTEEQTITLTPCPSAGLRGEQIERLLDEIHLAVEPKAWSRIEALVSALVGLYGEGLERVLLHARAVASNRQRLDAKLIADDLVSSLLLVHDLHPVALEGRIERALDRVQHELPGAARLELVEVESGIAKIRPARGESGSPPALEIVARAIEREAPEVACVQIDGGPVPAPLASETVLVGHRDS